MPKRSNDFQKLIYEIYNQLVPTGAVVTESAMVPSNNTQTLNEVDILIEHNIAGLKIRIAIECRARSRKDDKTWINDLIGKYIDLPVNMIVAVSRSGFSEGAKEKAKQHNIETLSFQEAAEVDWQNKFVKLGLSILNWKQYLRTVTPDIDTPIDSELNLKEYVFTDADGEEVGNLYDFAIEVYERKISSRVDSYIRQNFLNIFKVKSDLDNIAFIEYGWLLPLPAFINVYGVKHQLIRLNFKIICAVLSVDQKLEHITFDDQVMISSWTKENGQNVNFIQKIGDIEQYLRQNPK